MVLKCKLVVARSLEALAVAPSGVLGVTMSTDWWKDSVRDGRPPAELVAARAAGSGATPLPADTIPPGSGGTPTEGHTLLSTHKDSASQTAS